MKSKTKIAELFDEQRKHAERGLGAQYDNTTLCQAFYNDAQSSYSDTVQFADDTGRRRRAMVNIQKIPQNIDAVVGFMAQNRRQAKFLARVSGDQAQELYSRNMNALYAYHRDNMNADQIESRQDLDLVVNGYGAIDTDLSYIAGNATTDPNGELLGMRLDPLRVYWDSKATAPNVMDARYKGYYSDYKLDDALSLFQNSTEEDFEEVSDEEGADKGRYVYNPWGGLYDKIKLDNTVEWSAKDEDMVRVYNHQWFEYETYYRCKNPALEAADVYSAMHAKLRLELLKQESSDEEKDESPDGLSVMDEFDFDPTADELTFDAKMKAKLNDEFDDLDIVSFTRKVFYTAVISGKHVFTAFKNVCQKGFTIKIKTGNYNERAKIWIGMVNAMIEPQKYFNKALTELMFTIASASKGGVYIEEDAVEDISDFEAKYAKTDGVIKVLSGSLVAGKIQDKARPAVPTGLENIIQLCDASISASGVDPAFLGNTNSQETGVLFKRRIRQIISKMWWVADAITLYQKEHARLCADLIRVWIENNAGEWVRITGQDGKDQFMQVSEDLLAPDYDVTIQEGAETPEDRDETAQVIAGYGDKFLAAGDPTRASALYAEAVGLLPLDGDVKVRISQVLNGNNGMVPMAQVQQLQQQLAALQSAQNQATINNLNSNTALNNAKANESAFAARNKQADTLVKVEDAHQKNIETTVIRQHAASATVNV